MRHPWTGQTSYLRLTRCTVSLERSAYEFSQLAGVHELTGWKQSILRCVAATASLGQQEDKRQSAFGMEFAQTVDRSLDHACQDTRREWEPWSNQRDKDSAQGMRSQSRTDVMAHQHHGRSRDSDRPKPGRPQKRGPKLVAVRRKYPARKSSGCLGSGFHSSVPATTPSLQTLEVRLTMWQYPKLRFSGQ